MDIYTMKDWQRDGSIKVKRGQIVEDEVFYHLRDCVPPTTLRNGVFQVGEPSSQFNGFPLYQTYRRTENGWQYYGLTIKISRPESFSKILSAEIN